MRRLDPDASARPDQAMELFHGPDHIGEMFDHVDGA
jgi:hypothetical protein